jgi:hypothetical protein
MNKRYRGKSDTVSIDLTDLVHPSLRVSNQGDRREIKAVRLSGGCILYGYDVFTSYRRRGIQL